MRREFKKKSKVLLIDDNYEHLVGIRELLNLEGTFDVVGIATTVTVGKVVDAGTYVITAVCDENELYLAQQISVTIVVNKYEEQIEDETTAEYNDTLSSLVVPTSQYGKWEYKVIESTYSSRANDLVFADLEDVI